MESEEIEIVNPDEKDYYDGRLFRVCVWCGNGYVLNQYLVYGNDNAEAILENVVAYAEENEPEILVDVDDVYSEIDEIYSDEYNQYIEDNPEGDKDTFISDYLGYIYIDATMEGANQPYYIRTENLRIEEVE